MGSLPRNLLYPAALTMMGRWHEGPPVDLTVVQWRLGRPLPQEGGIHLWKVGDVLIPTPTSPFKFVPVFSVFHFSLFSRNASNGHSTSLHCSVTLSASNISKSNQSDHLAGGAGGNSTELKSIRHSGKY